MPYCSNCGQSVEVGMKFCPACGSQIADASKNVQEGRKQVFEGEIRKCPNCGEILNSFMTNCPACGYELRGTKAIDSIREFSLNISKAESDIQKISLIRSFPIPNTKEDIFEFMILAATNFSAEHSCSDNAIRKDISDAWLTKIEQSYQKAKLLFTGDLDFTKIQNIYDETCNQIQRLKSYKRRSIIIDIILRTIGLWGGCIIFVIAFFVDIFSYANTSVFHLGGGAVMIIGALMVGKKTNDLLDVGVGVACGLLALLLGTLLQETFHENGSVMVLAGGTALIIVVVRLVKSSIKHKG